MDIRHLLDQPRNIFEGVCKSNTQYFYLGNREGLARVLGRYKFYVDTSDASVAPHLISEGMWESWLTLSLSRLKPNFRCIDVGANLGYYSIILGDICESVIAFEPQKKLASLVSKSAMINGLRGKVEVRQKSVGSKAGTTYIQDPEGFEDYKGSAYCREDGDISRGEEVELVSLDETVEGPIHFMKIDAEGMEEKVWAGAKNLIEEHKPIILLEFTPNSYENAEGFLEEIAKTYPLRTVTPTGGVDPISKEEILENTEFSMLWLEATK